jgi:hypothetical protein
LPLVSLVDVDIDKEKEEFDKLKGYNDDSVVADWTFCALGAWLIPYVDEA